MEINIDNAFPIVVKTSLRPLMKFFDAVFEKFQNICLLSIVSALERPLMSTLVVTSISVILLSAVTTSLLIIAAVIGIVVCIVVFEGFIFGLIMILAAFFTILAMGFSVIIQGLKVSFQRKSLSENIIS